MPIFRAFSLFYLGFGKWVKKGGEGEIGRFREILAKKITIYLPQWKKVGKQNQKKRKIYDKNGYNLRPQSKNSRG